VGGCFFWAGGWGLRIGCEWRGCVRRGVGGSVVVWWKGEGETIRRPLLKYAILYIPE